MTDITKDEISYSLLATLNNSPQNFKLAIESKEKYEWLKVINKEYKSLENNVVYSMAIRGFKDLNSDNLKGLTHQF